MHLILEIISELLMHLILETTSAEAAVCWRWWQPLYLHSNIMHCGLKVLAKLQVRSSVEIECFSVKMSFNQRQEQPIEHLPS